MLPGEADAAVHLDRPVGRAGIHVRQPSLGQGGGSGCLGGQGVKGVGRIPHQRPGRLDVAGHLCRHMLQGLERGDGAVELGAGFGVLDGQLQGFLRPAQAVGGQGHTRRVKQPGHDFPALVLFAEQGGFGYGDLLELGPIYPSGLVNDIERGEAEARSLPLDQEQADPLFGLARGPRHYQQDIGNLRKRDKHLGAGQHIAVFGFFGFEPHAPGVETVVGLKQGQRANRLARSQTRQPGLPLGRTAGLDQAQRGQHRREHKRAGHDRPSDLFEQDRHIQHAESQAAVGFGDQQTGPAQLGRLAVEFGRKPLGVVVQLSDQTGRALLAQKFPGCVLQQLLFG